VHRGRSSSNHCGVHMKQRPKSRQKDLVIQEMDNEILVYDLSSHRAFCLNEASALVWQACDGKNSISEIAQVVSRTLKSDINEDFVWVAVDRLKKEKLISNGEDITSPFSGLSRREVIKKIGFSTMVALPVVSSLVAPSAVHAQTVLACQCSGLLAPVSVCPPGFAECPQGFACVVAPGGCFNSGDGVIACNGTCQPPQPVCPPSSPGDCTCFGNVAIGMSCATQQCPGGCMSCFVTQPCIPQEVGPAACNGFCV
jgi:Coenzyme PQQ synthesis protein D (PqqD)